MLPGLGSSAKRHPFVTLVLSIGSLAAVHSLTIWAHEYIDHATPKQASLYAMDRGMENVELKWAMFWGDDAVAKHHIAVLRERVDELESALNSSSNAGIIAELANDINLHATMGESLIATMLETYDTASEGKIIGVELESALSESRTVLELALENERTPHYNLVTNVLNDLAQIDTNVEQLLVDADVTLEKDVIVEKEIEYVPVPAQLIDGQPVSSADSQSAASSSNGNSCVPAGASCRTNDDCCGFLTCKFAAGAGQRSLRCSR